MQQCLVVPYIYLANQASRVETDPPPEIKSFQILIMEKPFKINRFLKTMRPTADIYTMMQCLVVPYINPVNHVIRVQSGPALEIKSFHRLKPCGHLLGNAGLLALSCVIYSCFSSPPHLVSCVLIVSIPDLCLPSYFSNGKKIKIFSKTMTPTAYVFSM